MVVVSVLAWLFLVERGRSPMMACTVYGIFQWFRGVISERLAGWQVRLVGHFAATVIFTFAATFIARGVKRGEQVNHAATLQSHALYDGSSGSAC